MTPLEKELETALLDIYYRQKRIRCHASYFKRMLTCSNPRYRKGPVGAVRHLLTGEVTPGSGFRRLAKAGKLEWTVEALILQPKWKPLFTDWELDKAKARITNGRSN